MKAPEWFYKEIDKRRRAYFWSGQKTTTGAKCKITWDTVCRQISEGGLGIKNLETHNVSLLLKFIHKVHMSESSSWAHWIRSYVHRGNKRLGDNISSCSSIWRYLTSLIDLYRTLTIVEVGDGKNTCFWLDSWLGGKPLSIQFPALFSHVQNPNLTVADCRSEIGWQIRIRPITSNQADSELTRLMNLLENVELNANADKRFMRFGPTKHFSVKGCYFALNVGETTYLGNNEIWSSLAPKKCKIFAWLALHNRLSTKDRLARKGLIDSAVCPFGCNSEESLHHMLFHCPHASTIWGKFHIQNTQDSHNLQGVITNLGLVPLQQRKEWATIFIAVAWNIWLARNRKVFDNSTIPIRALEVNCLESVKLWAHKCRKTARREGIKNWADDHSIM
jgi:hypothetical protein